MQFIAGFITDYANDYKFVGEQEQNKQKQRNTMYLCICTLCNNDGDGGCSFTAA